MLCLRLKCHQIILSTLVQDRGLCSDRTIVDQILATIIRLFGPNYIVQLIDLIDDSTIRCYIAHFEARNGLLNLFELSEGSWADLSLNLRADRTKVAANSVDSWLTTLWVCSMSYLQCESCQITLLCYAVDVSYSCSMNLKYYDLCDDYPLVMKGLAINYSSDSSPSCLDGIVRHALEWYFVQLK